MVATYSALPWSVPGLATALVERDEKVGAAVSVGERETGLAHLLAGGGCKRTGLAIARARMGNMSV